VQGATGSRAGPFIGAGRRFGGDILLPTGGGGAAARSIREESWLASEVPSGIRGVGLWDVTRRAGELAVAAEEGGGDDAVR
jgi:hypothetical protein